MFAMDKEMEKLVDSAIKHADMMAMEEANSYHVLDERVEEAAGDAKRILKKKKLGRVDASMSVIFVTPESVERLEFVANLRAFLKEEAKEMVKRILADREAEEASGRKRRSGGKGRKRRAQE